MAFLKKTWKDRVSQYPNRRTITENGSDKTVTVARNEGTISEVGDAFNAATMNNLEERIDNEFGTVNSNLESLQIYSTSETRIGTWVDGRPMYRKVILDTYTQNTGTARNLDITGVYQYLNIEVWQLPLATSTTNAAPSVYYNSSSDYLYCYLSTPATAQLTIKGGSTWPKTCPIAIIITYTK